MTAIGSFTFRAANGDTLTANDSGQASTTGNANVLAIVEHATITGGTGRFAGATGNFTVRRLLARDTGSTIGFHGDDLVALNGVGREGLLPG